MSSSYFTNESCEYYPCHFEGQNCMFCYCPFYNKDCSKFGKPRFVECKSNGIKLKDCTYCDYPHIEENYQAMMDMLTEEVTKRVTEGSIVKKNLKVVAVRDNDYVCVDKDAGYMIVTKDDISEGLYK